MIQYNFPTVILYGSNAIQDLAKSVMEKKLKHLLLITDPGLIETGLANKVLHTFKNAGLDIEIYDGVHPNPIEEDVTAGVTAFKSGKFEALVALGGGSAMDVAKTIRFMAVHKPPLSQYDEALGGDKKIIHPLPQFFP